MPLDSSSIQKTRDRLGKYFFLLISLIAVILIFPFTIQSPFAEVGNAIFGLLVIMTTLASCDLARIDWAIAVALAASCIVTRGLILFGSEIWADSGTLIAGPLGITFLVFTTIQLLVSVLKQKVVDRDLICGGISVYLLFGITWGLLFLFLERLKPGSFCTNINTVTFSVSPPEFLYFSFETLTSLGLGDIVPTTIAARTAVVAECITGVLFIAIFISRLVGRYNSPQHTHHG